MKDLKYFILFILLMEMVPSLYAQPVSLTTVIDSDDMEFKLIHEQEREEKISMNQHGTSGGEINPTINVIANTNPGISTLQFDNLPKIVSEITNHFEGSFEVKNLQKKSNEELCSQKLDEMKQVVESQLKRSVYKSECTEPEFSRVTDQKMQFSSKATITFF